MLRRALGLTTVGVGGGAALAYQWAKEALGEDGLERLIKYDRVAIPAIVQYKWVEARCGKLSRLAPLLFPPVSEEEETARFAVLHERWAQPLFDIFMARTPPALNPRSTAGTTVADPTPRTAGVGRLLLQERPKDRRKHIGRDAQVVHRPVSAVPRPDPSSPVCRDPRRHTSRLLQRRLCPSAATLANLPLSPPAAVVEEELGVPLGEVFSEFEEAPLGCASIGQTHRAVLRASGERVVVKACRDT